MSGMTRNYQAEQKEPDKLKFDSAPELKLASSGAKNPKALSNAIELILQLMSEYKIPIIKNDNQERKFNAQVIYPIISQGDVIGSVVLISKDQKKKMTETEEKVAQSAAGFLSGQMEI